MTRLDGNGWTLYNANNLDILPTLADASVDCVVSDPPYPEISRDYGRMTEADWMEMMQEVVRQTRRILKPTGSAVFILQPNSRKVGSMRLWLWEFMVWAGKEWNIVQDAYWWNIASQPTVHTSHALMRPSLKQLVWLGDNDCHRNQLAVLWGETESNIAARAAGRMELKYHPSGSHNRQGRMSALAGNRGGGVTPYNVLPMANTHSNKDAAAAYGHGAGTPLKLADWWTRYLCPPGGVVADWFSGTGTMGLAALQNGCSFIGIEKMEQYHLTAARRLTEAANTPRQAALL